MTKIDFFYCCIKRYKNRIKMLFQFNDNGIHEHIVYNKNLEFFFEKNNVVEIEDESKHLCLF